MTTEGRNTNLNLRRPLTRSSGMRTSGDIGIMNQAGYLRITDRLKDMYIVGGFNVYPAEIEHVRQISALFHFCFIMSPCAFPGNMKRNEGNMKEYKGN